MNAKEELIEALKQLCKREGGHVAVAEAAGLNDQTLYQILKGITLPSGEPRGPGAKVQKKLEAAFPGWQVDHIKPLKCGGPDRPENMQWLTVEQHKKKTAAEAKRCRYRS